MGLEPVIFMDSPLGEYLKGTNDGDEIFDQDTRRTHSDELTPLATTKRINTVNQLRSDSFGLSSEASSSESVPSTPDLERRRRRQSSDTKTSDESNDRNRSRQPLLFKNERKMRKMRFDFLFSSPLRRKLGDHENSRYLERFRYILVTSQLLTENISVSIWPTSDFMDKQEENRVSDEQNARENRRFDIINYGSLSKMGYWAGAGGFVLVVAVLFNWLLRSRSVLSKHANVSKSLASLVIVSTILLFFYAHLWRKRLRSTRRATLDSVADFVSTNHAFDLNIARTIGIVQEVEFISRGYVIASPTDITGAPSTPVRSLRRKPSVSGIRKCKRLKYQVSSVLGVSETLYTRCVEAISELCNPSDFEKYLDIYDIQDSGSMFSPVKHAAESRLYESSSLEASDQSVENLSIAALKTQFREMHNIRRRLICCFLAVDATGDNKDLTKWRSVFQELRTLTDQMRNLASEIDESLHTDDVSELVSKYSKEQANKRSPQPLARTLSPPISPRFHTTEAGKWRSHMLSLGNLSSTLRSVEAKLLLLRESSARMERKELRARSTPHQAHSRRLSESISDSDCSESMDRSNEFKTKRQSSGSGIESRTSEVDKFLQRSSIGMSIGLGLGAPFDGASPSRDVSSTDSIVKQYMAIGEDLTTLMNEWEAGRVRMLDALAASNISGPMDEQSQPILHHPQPFQQHQRVLSLPLAMYSSNASQNSSFVDRTSEVNKVSPWSTQSLAEALDEDIVAPNPDRAANNETLNGDSSNGILIEQDDTEPELAKKKLMVETIASAIVRQQGYILEDANFD
ncbi:Mysoin-binding motif of peroxisomes-domain-containing protein [Dipodascopsis uninucleata]